MEALQRLHNRGSISTAPYEIDNSIKFESDNSEQLYRTPSSDGNMKTWTYSVWFKRTELGVSSQLISALDTYMYFETSDQAWLNFRSGSENFFLATNRVFRDTSAWYHAVIVCDTTDSTAADRAKLYINGERQTSYANSTYQNLHSGISTGMNKATVHRIGTYSNYGSYFNGYMAEANLIDGSALAPTEFGEVDSDTGIWIPKEYTGSYGTNGFYLDFADASDLGDDESGNGNDFTEGNITSADQATDTPTNNFCTLNMNSRTNGNAKNQEGGTKVTTDGGSGWCSMNATMGVKSGKWYWEAEHMSSDSTNVFWGVAAGNDPYIPHRAGGYYLGNVAGQTSMGLYSYNGQVYNGTWQNGTGHLATSSNDVLMFALDADNGYMYFGKNGTWGNSSDPTTTGGTAAATLSATQSNPWTDFILPSVSVYQGMQTTFNFGGYTAHTPSSAASDADGYGTFEYAPPSGYYALCTKNLEEYG